jgi:hypothetical protein
MGNREVKHSKQMWKSKNSRAARRHTPEIGIYSFERVSNTLREGFFLVFKMLSASFREVWLVATNKTDEKQTNPYQDYFFAGERRFHLD